MWHKIVCLGRRKQEKAFVFRRREQTREQVIEQEMHPKTGGQSRVVGLELT